MSNGIGAPVRRREDERLLTGQGQFSDDVNRPGQLYAAMVRSPQAHARIVEIDASGAEALKEVVCVLTGADVLADGLNPIPHKPVLRTTYDILLKNRDGNPAALTSHLPLPADKARFVGEAVAVVVARSPAAARDGAERVSVRYEPLPVNVDGRRATEGTAPQVWENVSNNVCIDAEVGERAAADAAFATAAHRAALSTRLNRVTGVPMEPRACVTEYDERTGRYTHYAGSGNVVRQKEEMAEILGVSAERVRVVARDVGGNFGTRNAFYPEFALCAWAARRTGKPVKWTCERSEAFLSDYQARDLQVEAELALDADGKFLALRGINTGNAGAHSVSFVPLIKGLEIMTSIYNIPVAAFRACAVLTNTPPTTPYRSAGRPEAMFVIERLIDIAARRHGIDRVELRRRNLIPVDALPYTNAFGITYDSGKYCQVMDRAIALADWAGFPARRAAARVRGRLRGIGVANYIEVSGGIPRERAEIAIRPDGTGDVVIGTMCSGQGHETSFLQVASEWLGIAPERLRLVYGDTDIVSVGGGSHAGRSMRMAGIVIGEAVDELVARAKAVAAYVLHVPADALTFRDGRVFADGGAGSMDLFEIAAEAVRRNDLPDALGGPLVGIGDVTMTTGGFPYGAAVAEVEIDPETGRMELVAYAAVDDVGRAINPLILHGQTAGAAAQGIGQAMGELCAYDPGTGQLLSGSFLDYPMPRADTLPGFAMDLSEVPAANNRLGVRAGGEGGTTPALAAVANATMDALAEFGIEHIDLPLTPERLWRAIRDACR